MADNTIILGYMRVSSRDQNEDRQRIALKEMGVPEANIYVDKQSGKDFERKQYKRMVRRLKPGMVLYIKTINRIGRNYQELSGTNGAVANYNEGKRCGYCCD